MMHKIRGAQFGVEIETGKRIRARRKECNLTQGQLGAMIGYKTMAISQIENATQQVSLRQLYLIARALDVTIADLVGDA